MEQNVLAGATFCTTLSLLTATGGETVHDSTVLLNYCIDGVAYSKSGTNADQTTPTTDYNTGVAFPYLVGGASVANAYGHGCQVVWAYDKDGTVRCMMGKPQSLDSAGNFLITPQYPNIPKDVCPFAIQTLKAGDTAAVNIAFGTSNWNASDFTNTIADILVMPSRPIVAV